LLIASGNDFGGDKRIAQNKYYIHCFSDFNLVVWQIYVSPPNLNIAIL